MIAAVAKTAKNTVQIAILFFEILIFVRFYKCKICERLAFEMDIIATQINTNLIPKLNNLMICKR
jgi:hypothetical protein